jgi:hypothetical protein
LTPEKRKELEELSHRVLTEQEQESADKYEALFLDGVLPLLKRARKGRGGGTKGE